MGNPLHYEKEILERIAQEATIAEDGSAKISVEKLHKIIGQEAQVLSEFSVKKVLRFFELCGYIKLRQDGFFDVDLVSVEARIKKLEKKA